MFKNYLNPENSNHNREVSPQSSRRSYFYGDPGHELHNQIPYDIGNRSGDEESDGESSQQKRCSKTWVWFGIAIVYLAAIGIVVAVLLLAPKYPSLYFHEDPSTNLHTPTRLHEKGPFVLVELDQGIPDPESSQFEHPYPFVQPHKEFRDSQNQFIPSPRDEVILFDINPRRRA